MRSFLVRNAAPGAIERACLPCRAVPRGRSRWAAVSLRCLLTLACSCAVPLQLPAPSRAQERAGFDVEADLVNGAYRVRGAPNVIVHAAPGFDRRQPLQLVVFLHGYSACVRVLMGRGDTACKPNDVLRPGWDLGRYHDAAHTNTLWIVPQLAYLKRDGHPGAFVRDGAFRAFLEELLRGPLAVPLGGVRSLRDVARVDVIAHSGGYRAALAVLERGGLSPRVLRSVVLFDALYGETSSFAREIERRSVAESPRDGTQSAVFHFVDISLPNGVPSRESRSLAQRLLRSLGPARVTTALPLQIVEAIETHPIVIATGTPPHRLVPATHLAEVLGALHRADARP